MKWATIDLCEPITKLFNIVAREGFLASWTTNNIQMIFKVKVSYVNFYRCEFYLKKPLTPPHTKPSLLTTPQIIGLSLALSSGLLSLEMIEYTTSAHTM